MKSSISILSTPIPKFVPQLTAFPYLRNSVLNLNKVYLKIATSLTTTNYFVAYSTSESPGACRDNSEA